MQPHKAVILYVEDSDDHAFLFERAARPYKKISIRRVCDGEEAKAYLCSILESGNPADRPTAVVTDFHMPRCNGLELLRWLHEHPVWHTLPAVVLSSSMSCEDTDRCYGAGARAYFVKPCTSNGFAHLFECLIKYWTKQDILDCIQNESAAEHALHSSEPTKI
ncbi:MAG TPA: response regulator [Opitutaceae bacterium]|nr:response regulator [Opitutaceae bacterium]